MEHLLTAFLFAFSVIWLSILIDRVTTLRRQIKELDNRVTALEEDDNRGLISFGQSEWHNANDSTPRMNHQVTVLTDEGRIAVGHIVEAATIQPNETTIKRKNKRQCLKD